MEWLYSGKIYFKNIKSIEKNLSEWNTEAEHDLVEIPLYWLIRCQTWITDYSWGVINNIVLTITSCSFDTDRIPLKYFPAVNQKPSVTPLEFFFHDSDIRLPDTFYGVINSTFSIYHPAIT